MHWWQPTKLPPTLFQQQRAALFLFDKDLFAV
jgi:hypothetical protein